MALDVVVPGEFVDRQVSNDKHSKATGRTTADFLRFLRDKTRNEKFPGYQSRVLMVPVKRRTNGKLRRQHLSPKRTASH